MMTNRTLLLGLALIAAPAAAQRPIAAAVAQSAKPTILTAGQRASAITAIEAALRQSYVFPDRVQPIVAALDAGLKAGRYDVSAPGEFADRVSADLRSSSNDKHLYLLFDIARYAVENSGPGNNGEAQVEAYENRRSERNHDGIAELKLLPGNVRYLKITSFEWRNDATGAVYDDAMRFLRGGDAIIIDLRGNGGGSQEAVRYLVSHFLPAGKLEMTFLEAGNPPQQWRALDYLPAGRLQGVPLYVLIDDATGSAAEAFAYDVQQFRLGELVGAKTAGAANNNRFVPIAPGFMLSVPYGRPVHSVSNSNWEGKGVEPRVAVSPGQALDQAYALALTRLAVRKDAAAEKLAVWRWALMPAEAKLRPPVVSSAELSQWAGRYGPGNVTLKDGALWFAWRDRPARKLIPLTNEGLFAVESVETIRLRFTGSAMEMLSADEAQPRVYGKS